MELAEITGAISPSNKIKIAENAIRTTLCMQKTLKKIKQIKNIEPEVHKEFLNVISLHATLGKLAKLNNLRKGENMYYFPKNINYTVESAVHHFSNVSEHDENYNKLTIDNYNTITSNMWNNMKKTKLIALKQLELMQIKAIGGSKEMFNIINESFRKGELLPFFIKEQQLLYSWRYDLIYHYFQYNVYDILMIIINYDEWKKLISISSFDRKGILNKKFGYKQNAPFATCEMILYSKFKELYSPNGLFFRYEKFTGENLQSLQTKLYLLCLTRNESNHIIHCKTPTGPHKLIFLAIKKCLELSLDTSEVPKSTLETIKNGLFTHSDLNPQEVTKKGQEKLKILELVYDKFFYEMTNLKGKTDPKRLILCDGNQQQ